MCVSVSLRSSCRNDHATNLQHSLDSSSWNREQIRAISMFAKIFGEHLTILTKWIDISVKLFLRKIYLIHPDIFLGTVRSWLVKAHRNILEKRRMRKITGGPS